jgi:Ca-activated chloride channel family protein
LFGALPVWNGCANFAGVTTGGPQDVASARAAIENGDIPPPSSITFAGFLSEHDIALAAPSEAGLLYASASAAWNKDFDAFTPLATIQIGFGTNIDEESFARSPLNVCLLIDKSASMAEPADARSRASKLTAVKIAVDRLLSQLDARDRVNVVTFDDAVQTRLEGAAGNDVAAIKSVLDEFDAEGGTELTPALVRAYQVTARNSESGRSDRVFLFTDALLRRLDERLVRVFLDLIEAGTDQNIGTTVLGVGTEFGHEIAFEISRIRGANYFFLSDYDRIVSIFDEEFDFFVTPVAYDVSLDISIPFEFDVASVYGLPTDPPYPHNLQLEIPTLFLSNRQGGGEIFVQAWAGGLVDFAKENDLAQISLSYKTPDGTRVEVPTIRVTLPAGLDPAANTSYFPSDQSRRAVLLLNAVQTLRNACADAYSGYGYFYSYEGLDRAIARLTEFLPYFDRMAEGLEDRPSPSSRSLSEERALIVQLLSNLQSRRF